MSESFIDLDEYVEAGARFETFADSIGYKGPHAVMTAHTTWPLSRTNVLVAARAYLCETIARQGDALVVPHLIVKAGEQEYGAYGVVVTGCIRSHLSVVDRSKPAWCHEFAFHKGGVVHHAPILIAVKTFFEDASAGGYIVHDDGTSCTI